MATELIAAVTAAAVSASINLAGGEQMQVATDGTANLTGGESVVLEYSVDAGSTWLRVRDSEFNGVVLNAGTNRATVNGPGTFRLSKTATSAAVGVWRD